MQPGLGTWLSIGRNREAFCSRLGRRRHCCHARYSCSGIFMLEDTINLNDLKELVKMVQFYNK